MTIIVVHGFHRLGHFLSDQKVTKESVGTYGFRHLPHFSGHPVVGVGINLTDAAIVAASSWVILSADGCFSSKKRSRAADIHDRRMRLFRSGSKSQAC
jgi:hypothetical protein